MDVFERHFALAEKFSLPMYFHSRATNGDFVKIIKKNRHRFRKGVVHSFTGDSAELKQLIDLDLFISVNGCSLKTE